VVADLPAHAHTVLSVRVEIGATYAVAAADQAIVCNRGTAMTVNLPAATGSGRLLAIKNIGAGTVTVDGDSGETIDGETTQELAQWDGVQIVDYVSGVWAVI
jgi:hypothetical protein